MIKCADISHHGRIFLDSLNMNRTEVWHLLGPNGAGKSTLLYLLSGIETSQSGQIYVDGQAIGSLAWSQWSDRRCLLEQGYDCPFGLTVSELMTFFIDGKDSSYASIIPKSIDECLNLKDLWSQAFEHLSGGQQQRVQIARCLLQVWRAIETGQALVLLDEPLSGLDIPYQERLMALLSKVASQGNVVVVSSHDVNMTARYASHVCLIKNGELSLSGESHQVLCEETLSDVFEHRFSSLPMPEGMSNKKLDKFFIST